MSSKDKVKITVTPVGSMQSEINELKDTIVSLKNELSQQQRDILHLQKRFTDLKDTLTLVKTVEEQLKDLDELKFPLQLFKACASK